jgi:hypothetical protein
LSFHHRAAFVGAALTSRSLKRKYIMSLQLATLTLLCAGTYCVLIGFEGIEDIVGGEEEGSRKTGEVTVAVSTPRPSIIFRRPSTEIDISDGNLTPTSSEQASSPPGSFVEKEDIMAAVPLSGSQTIASPKARRKGSHHRDRSSTANSPTLRDGSSIIRNEQSGDDAEEETDPRGGRRRGVLQKSHSFGRSSFNTVKKTVGEAVKKRTRGSTLLHRETDSSTAEQGSLFVTSSPGESSVLSNSGPVGFGVENGEEKAIEDDFESVILSPRVDLIEEDEAEAAAIKELQGLLLPTAENDLPEDRARNQVINELIMTEQEFSRDMVSFSKVCFLSLHFSLSLSLFPLPPTSGFSLPSPCMLYANVELHRQQGIRFESNNFSQSKISNRFSRI